MLLKALRVLPKLRRPRRPLETRLPLIRKLPIRALPLVLLLLVALPRLMLLLEAHLRLMLHPLVVLKAPKVLLKLRRPRRLVQTRKQLKIRLLKTRPRQLKVQSRKPKRTSKRLRRNQSLLPRLRKRHKMRQNLLRVTTPSPRKKLLRLRRPRRPLLKRRLPMV